MKLITPSVELRHPGFTEDEIKQHIVRCAQICYKHDTQVADPDAWLHRCLLDKPEGEPQHTSPLAHGTIYLTITADIRDESFSDKIDICGFYRTNKYSRVVCHSSDGYRATYYITTNYRVIYENHREDDLKYLTKPFKKHVKRYTFKVGSDIGVSREGNRHTTIAPSEQSTRYCNYSKDRFGAELSINMPVEYIANEPDFSQTKTFRQYCMDIVSREDNQFSGLDFWMFSNLAAEYSYMNLIRLGWKPEQARRILPLDTHTEVYYSAFEDDWDHFLFLRDHKNAHPDMQLIARMIKEQLTEERNKYK